MALMQLDTSNDNNTSSIENSQYPEFSCRGETLGTLSYMLKAMHFGRKKDSQITKIRIQDVGMSLVSQKAKSMIVRCNLRKDYFSQYSLKENVEFCVDISTLIQVLTIFGINCEYVIEYNKSTDYLKIWLSNHVQASITECQLFTFAELDEDIPDLRWNEHRIINRITVQTPFFKNIFNEIDALAKNEEIVWFYIKKGNEDDINIMNQLIDDDIINDTMCNDEEKKQSDIINEKKLITSSITIGVTSDTLQFQGTIPMNYDFCTSWEFNQTAKYQFRLSLLRPALRAISKSNLMRINFNQANTIQIQHIFHDSDQHGWVEFIILPQDNDFVDP